MAHRYILGQSQTGKSTLQKQYILDAINNGDGVFFLDPHGADTDDLLQYIPRKRRKDVYIFDPSREDVLSWNPLTDVSNIPYTTSTLIDAIKDAWGYSDIATPVMDMYLYFSIAALIEANQTLLGLPYLLTSPDYRERVLKRVSDEVIVSFWLSFNAMSLKDQRQEVSSTLNKALMLIADNRVRRLLAIPQSSFRIPDVLDGKIFFARLPQGKLSIGRVKILGSILLSQFHQAALSRETTKPFHFFLDECHNWAPSVVKEMLTGILKFNCHVNLAHQYIDQLDKGYFTAIMGNCSEKVIFRVSEDDAEQLYGPDKKNGPVRMDKFENYRARVFPYRPGDKDLRVEPIDKNPYAASLRDIEANHSLTLTVPKAKADALVSSFLEGL